MREWVIYGLADPRTTEVRYVGFTVRGVKRRLREHLCRARTGGRTHRDCWVRSLLNAGLKPTIVTLEMGSGPGWQERERFWIAAHSNLVNHTDGGEGTPGMVVSEETRRKQSLMRRGRPYRPGRVAAMKGRTHTPEARAKIAAANRGRQHREETRAKMSAAKKGHPPAPSVTAAARAAKLGRPMPEEVKAKIAAGTKTRRPVVVVETGQEFPSITAAARAMGVTSQSIAQATRKGCRCKGVHWRRA